MSRPTIGRVFVVVAFCFGVYAMLEKTVKYAGRLMVPFLVSVAIACFIAGRNHGVRQMLCSEGHRATSVRSWLLAKGIRPNVCQLAPEVIRSQFARLPFVPTALTSDAHSHPGLAADRTSGANFMDLLAASLGLERYSFQKSSPDVRHNVSGNRYFYWSRDVAVPYSNELPEDGDLVTLVDTDYYVPMEKFLTSTPFGNRPVVLYTVGLKAVSSTDVLSGMYTFDSFGQMHTSVPGGSEFIHKVWNWDTDTLVVVRRFLGMTWRVAVYNVDRRACSGPKQLVLLTPIAQFRWPWSLLAAHLPGKELERVNPVAGAFLRLCIVSRDGYKVSTGRVGMYQSATIRGEVDEAIAIAARLGKTTLSIPTVMSYFPEGQMDRERAAVLCDYHREKVGVLPGVVYPVECAARTYQFSPPSFDPDAPALMVPFMSPLIHAGFVPADTAANARQAISGRVTNITMSGLTYTARMITLMKEFVDLVAPEKAVLSPGDYEETLDRQKRPSQRRVLEAAEVMGSYAPMTQEMFIKREAYAGVRDPRVIRVVPAALKLEYASFIYPLADYMKRFPWYASGMTPQAVAERLASLLAHAKNAVEGDANRWDGRVSPALRFLERLIMMRLFKPPFRSRLSELMESQFNQHCALRGGKGFESGTDRSSGSMETSAFNALSNAFLSYAARRACRVMNHFRTPQEAFEDLGLILGDDSLTIDIDPEMLKRTALQYGQSLAVVERKRGDAGVMFLARCYGPGVWHGDSSSMCDLVRQLSKFHLAVRMDNVTPAEKLVAKCLSFVLSDANTPVIGEFCRAVLGAARSQDMDLSPENPVNVCLRSYQVHETENYPNENAEGWMDAYAAQRWPRLQFDRFRKWLEDTDALVRTAPDGDVDITAFLSPPLCSEDVAPSPRATVVCVGDDGNPEVVKGVPAKILPPVRATKAQKSQFRAQRHAAVQLAVVDGQAPQVIGQILKSGNTSAANVGGRGWMRKPRLGAPRGVPRGRPPRR